MKNNLIPINGQFENPKALLFDIANEDIKAFVIISVHKDETIHRAQIGMTRADMAYASVELAAWSRE